jgi:hypothetical protein
MKKHLTPAVLIITITLLLTASHASGAVKPPKPPKIPPTLTGTISVTDKTWVCSGPVNLDALNVTISQKMAGGDRKNADAVHLQPGCTGRIGVLVVTNSAGDAVKVAQGAHDLTIGSGVIRCPAKSPKLHQDGVQAMGGDRITFQNLLIDCGRAADSLIDSNFFVNQAGQSTVPPSDIVCDHCVLGAWTAHTTSIQTSLRSGIRNSTLCVGRFPKLTVTIGSGAVSPVNSGNLVQSC